MSLPANFNRDFYFIVYKFAFCKFYIIGNLSKGPPVACFPQTLPADFFAPRLLLQLLKKQRFGPIAAPFPTQLFL
jgi:hypothetical protein